MSDVQSERLPAHDADKEREEEEEDQQDQDEDPDEEPEPESPASSHSDYEDEVMEAARPKKLLLPLVQPSSEYEAKLVRSGRCATVW